MINIVAIIPVYNEQFILPICICNLKKNGIEQIIVLNNESTDHSAKVAIELGAKVIDFSSHGVFCEETISKKIKETIRKLPQKINWIIKLDADEFLFSPIQNMKLVEFINNQDLLGFNCIGSYSHQTYPMLEEIDLLRKNFDPVILLNHVIPHIKNNKYPSSFHKYAHCIWKINVFKRELEYLNPHFVQGQKKIANKLILLKHIPYTIPEISRKRIIEDRKARLGKRNFEIGLSIHYMEIPDDQVFVFDEKQFQCFKWKELLNSYLVNFDETLNRIFRG